MPFKRRYAPAELRLWMGASIPRLPISSGNRGHELTPERRAKQSTAQGSPRNSHTRLPKKGCREIRISKTGTLHVSPRSNTKNALGVWSTEARR